MRAVNLLPKDEARRSAAGPPRLALLVALGGAALVTALAGLALVSARGEAEALRSEVAALEDELARVPKPPAPSVPSGELLQERTSRLAALAAATSGRVAFDRILREVALVLPEDAWLTGLTATAPTAPAEGAPAGGAESSEPEQDVTIEGVTTSHEGVARVLARLDAVPSLGNVQLTAITRVDGQQAPASQTATKAARPASAPSRPRSLFTFSVSASVRGGGIS
ncbi:MAG: PilN domain-containing protein [Thermoleophilia bacterium]|nr:PilN domain-containing protein [Gaiellaceae bacterium]MDW8339614.1 PilN domain-containing protein [Thermoleophilia bacterium]